MITTCSELLFVGQARCGPTYDLAAARADGIIADSGYHDAGGTVRTPIKRKKGYGLSQVTKWGNREHAWLRSPDERGFAQLKCWKVLRKVRISPIWITQLTGSILTIIRIRSLLEPV